MSSVPVALLVKRAEHLHQEGYLAQAEQFYRLALDKGRRNVAALHGLASIARSTGRLSEAHELFAKVARIAPSAESYADLGGTLLCAGQHEDAVQAYRKALTFNASHVLALVGCGTTLLAQAKLDEALACFDKALAVDPVHSDAQQNRAYTLMLLERLDEALAGFDRCLAEYGETASSLIGRGYVLSRLARDDDALASFERACAVNPRSAEAHFRRGNQLKAMRCLREAIAAFDHVIMLVETGQDDATAPTSNLAAAYYNRGICRLWSGDLAGGFADYEWRWQADRGFARSFRSLPQPLWKGEPLDGKAILLHAEQGFGDTVQFCRYAPLVAERGARVILEVPGPLLPLMTGLPGVTQVLAKGGVLPRFDLHCPLLSLPAAFKTDLSTIPAGVPYLNCDSRKLAEWRQKLGPKLKPRIGLAWSGSTVHAQDNARTVSLQQMLPLLDARAEWVSLQRDVRETDAPTLAECRDIVHVGGDLGDFADTAAAMETMDLIIAVDTSVAHLAGAIGKPAWILLPFIPDWRWMLERTDTPWYPTVRLFRQTVPGDWAGVIARMREALDALF
jgi:tetratricopeptide (TPR) repeat protein